jgi:hypothetical protein
MPRLPQGLPTPPADADEPPSPKLMTIADKAPNSRRARGCMGVSFFLAEMRVGRSVNPVYSARGPVPAGVDPCQGSSSLPEHERRLEVAMRHFRGARYRTTRGLARASHLRPWQAAGTPKWSNDRDVELAPELLFPWSTGGDARGRSS